MMFVLEEGSYMQACKFGRKCFVLPLCAAILLCGCSVEAAESDLAFSVHVTLSQRAAAKLASTSEAMIVSASYSGAPKPSAEKHADEVGQINLGAENVEAAGKAGTVHVPGAKVNRDHLSWVEGPIMLNVNVYSARHAGPDNILSCDIFDGPLQDAVRKPISLNCSLIAEKVAVAVQT